jgi:spermidine synthase
MTARAAAALVFVTSASVLVLEILAGRLLAPYVGVTLETFTGIIGTILAGIAAGNWLGGKAADRSDPARLVGPLVGAAGILALLSVPIVDFLGAGLQGAGPSVIVTLTLFGFFLPATLLAAVSPMAIKLSLRDLDDTGKVVGRLEGVGTAGALTGTFVTGFVLIAQLPTRPTLRILGVLLVLLGVTLAARLRGEGSGREATVQLLVPALLAGTLSLVSPGPCEVESAYFCASIEVDPDRAGGRILRLDTLRHSYVDLDDPEHLEFSYAQALSDVLAVAHPAPAPLDVAHIGGGGFTFPRYLRSTRPGSISTVLEIDPLLPELAVDELGFVPGDDVEVRVGDARLTLGALEPASLDLVIGDAFGGVSVPWHLTTREFVELVRSRLRPGGTYALNMIDYGERAFARAEMATIADVFEHVVVLTPPERLGPRNISSGGNYIIAASIDPLDLQAMLARNASRGDDEAGASSDDGTLAAFIDGAPVLVDDDAPVDQLLTPLPTG